MDAQKAVQLAEQTPYTFQGDGIHTVMVSAAGDHGPGRLYSVSVPHTKSIYFGSHRETAIRLLAEAWHKEDDGEVTA